MGIGTELIKKSDKLLSKNNVVERSMGACVDGDRSFLQFLYKNGYYICYSSYIMEREGESLPESNISIRQYEDAFGVIGGNELRHVSVRPNLQSRGYGRAFVSFLVNEIRRRGEKNREARGCQRQSCEKIV